MKITIALDDSESAILDGFCTATGKPAEADPASWMNQRVELWIRTNALTGQVLAATAVERKALADATKAATAAATKIKP